MPSLVQNRVTADPAMMQRYDKMGPTVSVSPIRPPPMRSGLSLYSIEENSIDGGGQPPEYTRPYSSHEPSYTTYAPYPGGKMAGMDANHNPFRSAPRPFRNYSSGSVTTVSSDFTRESIRSSSWGSRTSLDSLESSRFGERVYQRPEPLKKKRVPQPHEVFEALPNEVLELVLEYLRLLHVGPGSDSCATCWMRDLCNLSLCCRRWYQFARVSLYEDIQLVGQDSIPHRKKFKLLHGARLVMLRRTLRSNTQLAQLVRSLKVPRPDSSSKGAAGSKGANNDQYDDLVASVVMACPNLEELSGMLIPYNHDFRRLFHALSTRSRLNRMDWLIGASTLQKTGKDHVDTQLQGGLVAPPELELFEEIAFFDHHRNWANLSSLSVHCLPGATLTPNSLLAKILGRLPALRHLHLCNLAPNAFDDRNLLALPRLETLTLSHISGITSSGLSAFATRANSFPLCKLHLRHTPLTSLAALARIFSNLNSLSSFSLIQGFPPRMPEEDSFALWMMPYLASASITKLHWDITSNRTDANPADDILARSIAAGGFPELRSLRAPNDPEGIFQGLCRPVEKIELPGDRFGGSDDATSEAGSPPSSPNRRLTKSSTGSAPVTNRSTPAACTDLRTARLAAQARLEDARSAARFCVNVTSEEGELVETFGLGGFIGAVGSEIQYQLLPDVGSSDAKGGLVDVRDLDNDSEENLADGGEGCIGAWNQATVVTDKKEKERWLHTERKRWRKIELD